MVSRTENFSTQRQREQVRRSRKRVIKNMQVLDQEARDLAMKALALSKAHEDLCDERWLNHTNTMNRVEKTIGEIKNSVDDKIGRLPAGLIAGLTGIIGFLAARVFH